MTTQKILIKEDSKPYLMEYPDKLDLKFWPGLIYKDGLWQEALEQAKQSAVPFDYSGDVISMLLEDCDACLYSILYCEQCKSTGKYLSKSIYDIPTGYRVEIKTLSDRKTGNEETFGTYQLATLLPTSKEETDPEDICIKPVYTSEKKLKVVSKEESQPIQEEKQKIYLVMTKQLLIVGCFNTEEKANKYANGANVIIQEIEVY